MPEFEGRYLPRRWLIYWHHPGLPWPGWVRSRGAAQWVAAYMRWKADGYP